MFSGIVEEMARVTAIKKYGENVDFTLTCSFVNELKIDQSIADADSLKAQQKLQALREREIDYLREKENLTEYDLRTAEARYQIALKEIALEDAQNNKTSMKLTRNEQGNWSYQYVADEEDIVQKQQDLMDVNYQYYEMAKEPAEWRYIHQDGPTYRHHPACSSPIDTH